MQSIGQNKAINLASLMTLKKGVSSCICLILSFITKATLILSEKAISVIITITSTNQLTTSYYMQLLETFNSCYNMGRVAFDY